MTRRIDTELNREASSFVRAFMGEFRQRFPTSSIVVGIQAGELINCGFKTRTFGEGAWITDIMKARISDSARQAATEAIRDSEHPGLEPLELSTESWDLRPSDSV